MDDPGIIKKLASRLHLLVTKELSHPMNRSVIVFCVGTDRSTGDALGPLVGSNLVNLGFDASNVRGTLELPVHGGNIHAAINEVYSSFENPYVIAIDACLGKLENVGMITASPGPLKPGSGVGKTLPYIGDIHVTGVVNAGGFREYEILQSTRLSMVMRMADIISRALAKATEAGLLERAAQNGRSA